MGMTAALVTMAVGTAVAAGAGTYSAIDSHQAAKASEKAAKENALAQAGIQGAAAAKEDALRQQAEAGKAKEAQNLDTMNLEKKKKRGVKSSYTATGAGAGNLQGTTLTPIGGGDGSTAIAAV